MAYVAAAVKLNFLRTPTAYCKQTLPSTLRMHTCINGWMCVYVRRSVGLYVCMHARILYIDTCMYVSHVMYAVYE